MDLDHLNQATGPRPIRWHAATRAEAISLGRDWLLSPAFRSLASQLGGPRVDDPARDLPALLRWSADALDTRRGGERHDAPPAAFSSSQVAALLDAAGPLGLLSTPPPALPGYDITVVLGGTVTGNQLRAALARTFADAGTRLGTLVALSAERPLAPAEDPPTGHRTEVEHLTAVLGAALARQHHAAVPRGPGGTGIQVMIAKPSRPGRRADTSDAITELIRRLRPAARSHVLVITSAIYIPYQFLVIAPALLTAGSRYAEITGTPTATDGQLTILAQRLAQEIHATISALAGHLSHSHVAQHRR
ncbi:MAG TPA: hypothetical protein VNF47_02085 [Streptosporangiaceae bacterium]|nr:hypothetical protein [Streptosporangiaceae bacterium]